MVPILLLLFLPLSANGRNLADIDMKEGLWEISADIKIPGMPVSIPPMTQRQCITREDLTEVMNQAEQGDQDCRTANLAISDNRVIYDIECGAGASATRGHAEFTYAGDRMQGIMKISGPQGMETTTRFTGRRVGDCR